MTVRKDSLVEPPFCLYPLEKHVRRQALTIVQNSSSVNHTLTITHWESQCPLISVSPHCKQWNRVQGPS